MGETYLFIMVNHIRKDLFTNWCLKMQQIILKTLMVKELRYYKIDDAQEQFLIKSAKFSSQG